MCGISGFFAREAFGSDGLSAETRLKRMTISLQHRGPDGTGLWISADSKIGLGHARLSIIDLESGSQPMVSPDGRFIVVFNGEIYNFHELRSQLAAKQHTFRTKSDTEVILAGYREWQEDLLPKLSGMFAFALYDLKQGELFLARDRVGIKPLYFADSASGFFFASEIKAILANPEVRRAVDPEALCDYFVLGYPTLPRTCFQEVRELSPGTWMRLGPKGTTADQFWRWKRSEDVLDFDSAVELTEAALIQTLQEHLVSDVPIGAFLSGGVDSSLLVGCLARTLGVKLSTFTVSFEDRQYDESPYAQQVAQSLGVPNHRLHIANASVGMDTIQTVMTAFDQPFADSSAIPTYMVCRETRKHVKVVMSGDGGDEMFGGYPRFRYADWARAIATLPVPVLESLRALARGVGRLLPAKSRQATRLVTAAAAEGGNRLIALTAYTQLEELNAILKPEAVALIGGYRPRLGLFGKEKRSGGDQLMDATVRFTLPGDYLRKVDVMSSAHGLEVRVPFLGNQILDLAMRIPSRFKYVGATTKRILRVLLSRYVDEELGRRPKAGFGIPLDAVLGNEDRRAIGDLLSAKTAFVGGLVQQKYLHRLLQGFVTGQWDHSKWSRFMVYQRAYLLWSLESWAARWKPSL
jgi:asparagine synthase (glutamine-hydrolysing)